MDVKRTLAEQSNPEKKPVMSIEQRIENLKTLHAYFSKIVSFAAPFAIYYYFLKLFFVVLKYSHSQIADDSGPSACTKQATLMLCENMQVLLARFPQCKPRCISSNINENLFSRGVLCALNISSCCWHVDFQFEERNGSSLCKSGRNGTPTCCSWTSRGRRVVIGAAIALRHHGEPIMADRKFSFCV